MRNPYKGLQAFTEADAGDFFGREALTARLVTRLREDGPASRFLAVVGASGSGKSSVVRAGLIPAVRAGVLPGSASWFVVQMTPGAAPFEELEAALLRVAVDPPESLIDELQGDDAGLLHVADRILPDGAGGLLLVVDQFEEVFTLVTDDDRQRRFLDVLVTAVTDPRSRLRVVVTLRADFYDRPLRHRDLAELLRSRIETVTPLTPAEIERAVTGPAEQARVRIGPGLAAQIVTDVADQPGALPLLQYALTELFDRRRDSTLAPDTYREIGGVSGALARRAEAIHAALADEAKQAARQMFLRLVTVGEGADDVRRRVLRADLVSLQPDPADMEAVIEAFGGARLLSFDRDPETREPTVEVAHEALLREWGRLRGWIDAAREDLRVERRLTGAARDWDDAGRDASFLASGSRLDQFETWRQRSDLASTPLERDFLQASLTERHRLRGEDEARKARERALERRSFRRLRALVAVLAVAAVVASGLTVFAFGQRQRAAREARVAGARELAAAAVANLDVDPERSILLALEAVDRTRAVDGSVLPEAEEALHRGVIASRVMLTVPGQGGALDWSSDGTRFVTEGPENTGVVDIRDADTGASLRSWRGHDVDINDVAFSDDSAMLATTGDDSALRVWDPRTGEELAAFRGRGVEAEVWGPSFSPDGKRVAAAWPTEGLARVWDLATGRVIVEVGPLAAPIGAFFSPDGNALAIPLLGEPAAVVVDAASGEPRFTLESHEWPLHNAAWSPDGRWIATVSLDLTTRIWDAATGDLRFTLHGHSGAVLFADWSPDSTRLVTGSEDGTAKVWGITDTGTRELLTLSGQGTQSGVGVAFSPDGDRVMTGNHALSAVQIWDVSLTGDAEWSNAPASTRALTAISFTPGGDLAIGNEDGSVTIRDAETGRKLLTSDGHGTPDDPFSAEIYAVAANPDGTMIAVAGGGGPPVTVWDATTGREVFTFYADLVVDLAWSPDGRLLAAAGQDGATIIDRSGDEISVLREPGYDVATVRFSPDGRRLATSGVPSGRQDPTRMRVQIWDWERGEVVRTIPTSAPDMAFDPGGSRLATGHPEGLVHVWDVSSGERLRTLAGHSGFVWSVVFSPDGSRIATAGPDSTVRLWDAESGTELLVLRGHQNVVSDVAFSPDGSKLASVGTGVVRVWAIDLDDLIAIANTKVTRTLTDEECRQYLHIERCHEARARDADEGRAVTRP